MNKRFKKGLQQKVQLLLSKIGYQIIRYPLISEDRLRLIKILSHFDIGIVFDIGANEGQFAKLIRSLGYTNKIISFEPVKKSFIALQKASQNDKKWIVNNYALGNSDSLSTINLAGNSESSSILNMLPLHSRIAPESGYIGKEQIELKKIDSIISSYSSAADSIMLKIDTQGYEKKVIEGALNSLSRIKLIQIELSLIQLYENEDIFLDMVNFLDLKGFQLLSIENGLNDKENGFLYQVDGVFVNKIYL